jgi:hypothetical protein
MAVMIAGHSLLTAADAWVIEVINSRVGNGAGAKISSEARLLTLPTALLHAVMRVAITIG